MNAFLYIPYRPLSEYLTSYIFKCDRSLNINQLSVKKLSKIEKRLKYFVLLKCMAFGLYICCGIG